MRKNQKPTPPAKHTNLRQLRSSTTAAANSTPSKAFQKPSKTSQEEKHRPQKAQKRKRAAEDELSPKRLRRDLKSASVPAAASQDLVEAWQTGEEKPSHTRHRESVQQSRLSEKNLKRLERDLKQLERDTPNEMSPGGTVPKVRKRAPSRQASLSDLNQDTSTQRSQSTQKSTVSNGFYRFHVLDRARVYVRPERPPLDIQAQMDNIFERDIPEQRRREISDIAEVISQKFIKTLRGAQREDDLVEIVYSALDRMMNEDMAFVFSRKAGNVLHLTPMWYVVTR